MLWSFWVWPHVSSHGMSHIHAHSAITFMYNGVIFIVASFGRMSDQK